MQKLLRGVAVAVTTLALASACGGTVDNPSGKEAGAKSGKVTVETARGKVTLPKAATKVVSLEWSYTEELLALGVTPVGNADNAGYGTWVTAGGAELPKGVADVGTRQAPSLETIKNLKPDVIISDVDRLTENFDALNDIAPVLAFQYTASPQLENLGKTVKQIGVAVGKTDEADELMKKIDTAAADLSDKLQKAGKQGTTYALGQGFTAEGAASIRMFTDQSLAAQVLNLAGLKNAWTGKPDAWGMTTVGVEGLTGVGKGASFLYVASEKDNPFTGALAKNQVWNGLEFVKGKRVYPLDSGTWVFGGPLSCVQLLEETGKALKV
ncbi:MAG: ABC transporter substrate-binding protein [Micromonosporaceae bacterium]